MSLHKDWISIAQRGQGMAKNGYVTAAIITIKVIVGDRGQVIGWTADRKAIEPGKNTRLNGMGDDMIEAVIDGL